MIYFRYNLFDNKFFSVAAKMFRYDPDRAGSVINCPPGSRKSGSVIQDYGFTDPDLKEIFMYAQQNTGIGD
jgi:hypothetical protein